MKKLVFSDDTKERLCIAIPTRAIHARSCIPDFSLKAADLAKILIMAVDFNTYTRALIAGADSRRCQINLLRVKTLQ